jgi:hypothetical protein
MPLKKSKTTVIKIFKVVLDNEAEKFNKDFVKNLLVNCNDFFSLLFNQTINYIEINYNSRYWKSVKSFRQFLDTKNNLFEIVYLRAHTVNSFSNVTYTNNLLNQIKRDEINFVDLIIELEMDINNLTLDILQSFLNKLLGYYDFDYGYCFPLLENQDSYTEIIQNKGFLKNIFGKPLESKEKQLEKRFKREKELLEVKNGVIPQIYPINILNNDQLKKTNIESKNIITLDKNLSLVIC